MRVRGDPDNRYACAGVANPHRLSKRATIGPVLLRERPVDDHASSRAFGVERTSFGELNAHRREVTRFHRVRRVARTPSGFASTRRRPYSRHAIEADEERDAIRHRDAADARQRTDAGRKKIEI